MTSSVNNNNATTPNPAGGFDLYLTLKPPGSEGAQYSQLATNLQGVPIGSVGKDTNTSTETLTHLLGYSNQDTIGSALDEIVSLASQLNISFLSSAQGTDDTIQTHLNTLDPTAPSLPPIRALLIISERSLAAGKIGTTQLDPTSISAHTTDQILQSNPDAIPTPSGGGHKKSTLVDPNSVQAEDRDSSTDDSLLSPNSRQQSTMQTKANGNLALNQNLDLNADPNADIDQNEGAETSMANPETKNTTTAPTKNQNTAISTSTSASQVTSTNLGQVASKGNPWLSGNVYVGFLIVFMQMQRIMMKNKVVQGQIELNSMNLVTQLAQTTSDLIMNVAKQNQMIHITTAVMSGVSIAVTVGGLAYGAMSSSPGALERGSAIGSMGSQLEKLTTASMQAATDISIATQEGRKEVLSAYRQIAQTQMQKAGDAFKTSADAIVQLLQTLDKIRDGLEQAVSASLRR